MYVGLSVRYVHTSEVTQDGQKRASKTLELELLAIVGHSTQVLRSKVWSSARAGLTLNA